MSKMIQIRNVPDELHRKLKLRAVEERTTMSELLVREARDLVERPSLRTIRARLEQLGGVKLRTRPAAIIRHARGD